MDHLGRIRVTQATGPRLGGRPRALSVLVFLAAGLLLPGCGGPSVSDRLAALVEGGEGYRHQMKPSPARQDALYGDRGGGLTSEREWTLANRLRQDENARAILDAGEAVVPELVPLLDDERLRTLAAVFLGEIGGQAAAEAVLKRWRSLRETRIYKCALVHEDDSSAPRSYAVRRYDGVDGGFYGEILFALAYCGLPVSAQIAADTRSAMEESERLLATGRPVRHEATCPPDDRDPHGSREIWDEAPIETAREGLELLAMVGAPEAPDLFCRALDSPVDALRRAAVSNALYLGDAAKPLIPRIARFLDDPGLQGEVLYDFALLLGTRLPDMKESDAEMQALADEAKAKLVELGYLPR